MCCASWSSSSCSTCTTWKRRSPPVTPRLRTCSALLTLSLDGCAASPAFVRALPPTPLWSPLIPSSRPLRVPTSPARPLGTPPPARQSYAPPLGASKSRVTPCISSPPPPKQRDLPPLPRPAHRALTPFS